MDGLVLFGVEIVQYHIVHRCSLNYFKLITFSMRLAVASTSRQMLIKLVEGGRDGHTLAFYFILFRDVRTIYYLTTILTGKKSNKSKQPKNLVIRTYIHSLWGALSVLSSKYLFSVSASTVCSL